MQLSIRLAYCATCELITNATDKYTVREIYFAELRLSNKVDFFNSCRRVTKLSFGPRYLFQFQN